MYGLAILAVMSYIVLPLVGAESMSITIGSSSFLVEHPIFGMAPDFWPLVRPEDLPPVRSILRRATKLANEPVCSYSYYITFCLLAHCLFGRFFLAFFPLYSGGSDARLAHPR